MPLSCSCPEWYGDSPYWEQVGGYRHPPVGKRKRCCSCKELINWTDLCIKFLRIRLPTSWVEENIYGDEVPLAPDYMCERCADIYFSLEELGFCPGPRENMDELLGEYHVYVEEQQEDT